MAVARVACRAQIGLLAPVVQVEVHLGAGLPCFNIVGLPATEVKESKERVRAALVNSGFELPAGRITINLAPADLPKDGGRFDLAIAVGILAAAGQVGASSSLEQVEFLGELGLTGALRAIRGALPSAVAAAQAGHSVVLPRDNAADLQCMPGLSAFAAGSLLEVCAHLDQRQALPKVAEIAATVETPADSAQVLQLADVCGQTSAKLALEVAAAGGTVCCSSDRRVAGRACWPNGCRISCHRCLSRSDSRSRWSIPSSAVARHRSRVGRFEPRITRHRRVPSSVAGPPRVRARSRSPTGGCCFLMNCPSSIVACSKRCASRLRRES